MKLLRGSLGISLATVLGVAAWSAPLGAQALTTFSIERSLALNNILTTITPQAPANILASIAGGALEIRERLIYNAQGNTITSTVFLVPTGSPIPTPIAANIGGTTIAAFVISLDKIYVTTGSVLFVGKITSSTATPYGNYTGSPAALSVGYTSDTPAKIANVAEIIAGALVDWSAAGAGSVVVTQPPSGGGPGPGTGPTVVITGPSQVQGVKQARLDASGSTDPNKSALTYKWSTVGNPAATIIGTGTNAIVDVQLNSGFGGYVLQCTVTNTAGVSATGTFTIQYLGH
jgi:hypothetical protein